MNRVVYCPIFWLVRIWFLNKSREETIKNERYRLSWFEQEGESIRKRYQGIREWIGGR